MVTNGDTFAARISAASQGVANSNRVQAGL
jgi:hypothetical protein